MIIFSPINDIKKVGINVSKVRYQKEIIKYREIIGIKNSNIKKNKNFLRFNNSW